MEIDPHADCTCASAMLKEQEKVSGTISRRVAGRIIARPPTPPPHGSSHLTPRGAESVEPMEIGQLVEFEINGETRLQINRYKNYPRPALF